MGIDKNKQFERASFFIELGKPLAKAKTIKETLDIVMYQIGRIFQPVHWSLLLKEHHTGDMIFSIVVGSNKEKLQGMRLPKGEGIAGHIMRTRESVIVKKVDQDDRFSTRADKKTGFQTKSIIGVPLKTDDKIFGVIELINKISGDDFTSMELQVLSSIAEYAAIAIERSYYNQTLKRIALVDSLTGLKNRGGFERTLKNRREMMKRYGVPSSLIMVTVDKFWQIIDQYDHRAGDQVIKNCALVLKKSLRVVDEIFRYGGDKFAVLMPNTTLEKADKAKKRILNELNAIPFEKENIIHFEVSIRAMAVEIDNSESLLEFASGRLTREIVLDDNKNIGDMEEHLQPLLNEENEERKDEIKTRSSYRKKVLLSGDYRHFSKKEHGYIMVKDLSIDGIGFETMRPHNIEPDDILDVTFTLDDGKRSVIKRKVIIHLVEGRYISAEFYNPPPYDKNMGFYLMA